MVGRDLAEQFPARQVQSGNVVLEVKDFSTPHFFNKRVSFNARSGEIVGFAGLQGAGNSELFHGLSGSYGPVAEGAVKLNGKPYLSRSPSHAIASRLALLTNDRKQNGLVSGMSSVKNMTLASVKKVSTRGWIRRSRERTVAEGHRKKLNIRMSEVHQDVNELSGGNQQKVVLAKWLETDPRVLLLDEPTRGVDIGAKHEIYEWMNRWTDEGGTILLISSELQELMALSDRILVMHRGVIRAEFSREDATREKIVQVAMGVGG
jgi:ABC-type sugar transport system ATPase subunit